tara:strand:- start:158 stop:538 length:381 start_codon:yes stop_codon:yes gene_type:complete
MFRPEGFENENRDCTVRGLAIAANIPYEKVHAVFKKFGRKNRCGIFTKPIINKVFKELGINAKQVKRSGSLEKFLRLFPKGNYYVFKSGHAFAVIDGNISDSTKLGSHIQGAWKIIILTKNGIKNL